MRRLLAWVPGVVVVAGVALACGSDGAAAVGDGGVDVSSDAGGDEPGAVDWTVALSPAAAPAGKVSSALLGQYELSGSLFAYDKVAGLPAAMKLAGMQDWRVGVGRWEIATELLPKLTDGTDCAGTLASFPPSLFAPANATDLSLATARDWFVDDGNPVLPAAIDDDSRYALGYLRSVLDVADAFGARPLVNVDHMPRAFAANKTFTRVTTPGNPTPCNGSWTNAVSNCRPADEYLAASGGVAPIFPRAVVGLVKRVIEGTGDRPRAVTDWELWNEPDLPYAWDPAFDDMQHSKYFQTMATTLVLLDAYRTQSAKPLRFGLGSFAQTAYAVGVLKGLDAGAASVPVDFFSFHSYSNDPLAIVADIESMVAARSASKRYTKAELFLTEWGVDLVAPPPSGQIDNALLVATVIALGATAGLDRTYHSLFYDFVPGLAFGLVDNAVKPKPLYRAYELLAKLLSAGGDRFAIEGAANGRFDGGQGAAIAVRDPSGKLRVLVVNRSAAARSVRVVLDGASARAASISIFDDPAGAVHSLPTADVVTVAPRSIALLEM